MGELYEIDDFAPELLVRHAAWPGRAIWDLALQFGVSADRMRSRLLRLGFTCDRGLVL